MSDSILVWNFLTREFTNDHPVIYLHCCGSVRSSANAMDKALALTEPIFCPPLKLIFVKTIIKAFLDMKKKQYLSSEITIKSIY